MKHILVVDDIKLNLRIAEAALTETYMVTLVESGIEALEYLKEQQVDLILLDIEMPQMNGIETLKQIRTDDMIGNIPVIFLTAVNDNKVEAMCLTLGAQDFIVKPFYKPAMLGRIQRVLEFAELKKDLEGKVVQKINELERLTTQTITTFANAIDAKDTYTKGHSLRVAKYSQRLVLKLGWGELETKNLFYTALLHDIGKIGIPDYILNKPGKLTNEEYEIIKEHPLIGEHILEDVLVVPYLGVGANSHHERYDGKGYPNGRKGEEIPLVGRIVGISDAVDAMTSNRAYRNRMPLEKVIEELKNCSGTQFDPNLVDIMVDVLKDGNDFVNEEATRSDNNSLLENVINDYVKGSKVDALTGLWNSSYLEETVNGKAKDGEVISALLMIDLDNFRRINDTWGHVAGDTLLVNIAEAIRLTLTIDDSASRYAGDEFLVFLYDVKNRENVEIRVKELLTRIKDKIEQVKSPIQITASIGIAMTPDDGNNYDALFHNADKSLYYVKQRGKNNYYFFSLEEGEIEPNMIRPSRVDIHQLKKMFKEEEIEDGAYQVSTKDFQKIYQLMQRMIKRSKEMLQIILFTFTDLEGNVPNPVDLEEAFKKLIWSVKSSLRIEDVAAKYSVSQYVVLLKGAKRENAQSVTERIVEQFKELGNNENIQLHYDYEEVEYADEK